MCYKKPCARMRGLGARSALTEQEVRKEVGHVLVELVLWRQKHRLVIDEQQEHIEQEQQRDSADQHHVRADAVLLGSHAELAVERLEQVAETRADAIEVRLAPRAIARRCVDEVAFRSLL